MRRYSAIIFSIFPFFLLTAQEYSFTENSFENIPGRTTVEARIAELVNAHRQKIGLPPLQYDQHLQSAARQHSNEMFDLNYFDHTSPTLGIKDPQDRVYQTGLTDFAVGENVAVNSIGSSDDQIAERFMEQWLNSPGHRANIERIDFTHIGVGVLLHKDSSVTDTVINKLRTKFKTYHVSNYATQVFSNRNFTFSKLNVQLLKKKFLTINTVFQSDRGMLLTINGNSQTFDSDKGRVTIVAEWPVDGPLDISIAYAENYHTNEYVIFFQYKLADENLLGLRNRLTATKFSTLQCDIKLKEQEKFWLVGKGEIEFPIDNASMIVYVNETQSFPIPIRQGAFDFAFPLLTNKAFKIEWAYGSGQQKAVKNRLWIDLDEIKNNDERKVFRKMSQN